MITALFVLGALAWAAAGFAIGRLTARPREPQTDVEHADSVHDAARQFNIALHNARAAGLNPSMTLAPIDDELAPGLRPIVVGVARGTVPIRRTLTRELDPPDLGCTLPPPGWYCSREPGHEGACPARPR